MTKLDTNVAPYFDDYNKSKNYMKVLFKAGFPVQARELNTLQSALANQVEQFANHVFKNGTRVSGSRSGLNTKNYARLEDLSTAIGVDTGNVELRDLPNGTIIHGEVTAVTAVLFHSERIGSGTEATDTIYFVYVGTGADGETSEFIEGEFLSFISKEGNNTILGRRKIRCTIPTVLTQPLGEGEFFTLEEGVFYYEGMFIQCPAQTLLVHPYYRYPQEGEIVNTQSDGRVAITPCKIGLDLVQEFTTSDDDSSLLDPSLGYPNSSAPGADRYRVELLLTKRLNNHDDGDNFILLCRINENSTVEYIMSDSEYSELMDMVAKRDYEVHGNYTVNPFKIRFLHHKKSSAADSLGWSVSGNNDKLVCVVDPAVAYVKGYRHEPSDVTPVVFDKARDTKSINNYLTQFNERAYIILDVPAGTNPYPFADNSTLFSANPVRLSMVTPGQGPTPVGSVDVWFNDVVHVTGNTYKYYISKIKYLFGQATLNGIVDKISYNGATWLPGPNISVRLYNADKLSLVKELNQPYIASLRKSGVSPNNGSTHLRLRKTFSGVLDANGKATIAMAGSAGGEVVDIRPGAFVIVDVDGSSYATYNYASLQAASVNGDNHLIIDVGITRANRPFKVIVDVLQYALFGRRRIVSAVKSATRSVSVTSGRIIVPIAPDTIDIVLMPDVAEHTINVKIGSRDVSSHFKLVRDENVVTRDNDKLRLIRAIEGVAGSSATLTVTYKHCTPDLPETGYYDVDSYVDKDTGVPYTYETLPTTINENGQQVRVSQVIDFRPILTGTVGYNDYNSAGKQHPRVWLPAQESYMTCDVSYYLPRTDLLQLDKLGHLYIKKGIPSDTPKVPQVDFDSMALYEIYLKPYTFTLKDISTKFIENKRYTMRDIGRLEKRIERVEYYTALSLLEKAVADMSIKDEEGFDRFKNGFVVDNFSDFQAANFGDTEFKASLDRKYSELRPSFTPRGHRLKATSSNGVKWLGPVAIADYTEEVRSENPYATKHISINPFYIFNKKGKMVLSPNNDVWADTTRLPEAVTDISTGGEEFEALAESAGILNTVWGDWVTINQTNVSNEITPLSGTSWMETSVNVSNLERVGTVTTIDSRVDSYTIEDIVKDVRIIPYIRASDVQFYASGLRANTRVYAFFDNSNVTEHCYSLDLTQSSGTEIQTATWVREPGVVNELRTDDKGVITGVFSIPEGQFFTGQKLFYLSNDSSGTHDKDVETTYCEAVYFAGGLDVTKQNSTLNIATPTISTEQISETRTEEERIVTVFGTTMVDPVAQAFSLNKSQFLTSIDIYFQNFDKSIDGVYVEIRTMSNGYPTTQVLARKEFSETILNNLAVGAPVVSEDSTVPTHVEFDYPVYVEANTLYCFVVGGYSPETRIWIARLGESVVDNPSQTIENSPTEQPSFRSLNSATWNAEQFETIKYKLYGASFTPTTMSIDFSATEYKPVKLKRDPLFLEEGWKRVRVFAEDHGFVVGDSVSLSVSNGALTRITTTSGLPPMNGQVIKFTGAATQPDTKAVVEMVTEVAPSTFDIKLSAVQGKISFGSDNNITVSNNAAADIVLRDTDAFEKVLHVDTIPVVKQPTLNAVLNKVENNMLDVPLRDVATSLGGIPISVFNRLHQIVEVNSPNDFVISLEGVPDSVGASTTGFFGGDSVYLYNYAEKVDLFNVSGNYMNYTTQDTWSLTADNYRTTVDNTVGSRTKVFLPAHDTFLGHPVQVKTSSTGGNVVVRGSWTGIDKYVSPIVNTDTFAVTTVSNRIGRLNESQSYEESHPALSQQAASNLTKLPFYVAEDDATLKSHGTTPYKYITKNVRLADPASDLMIYFDAYRDEQADFDVYVKTIAEASESFSNVAWQRVTGLTKNKYSTDLTDRIEYTIKASEMIPGWGGDYIGFKVKLVGRSNNSSRPILFKSFRAIAVT